MQGIANNLWSEGAQIKEQLGKNVEECHRIVNRKDIRCINATPRNRKAENPMLEVR